MSYYNNPIADILNALAATSDAGNINQRGPQQQPQPQFQRFPQQFYYDPNDGEYEDDDDDYEYYRYPDYYAAQAAAPPFLSGGFPQSIPPAQFAAQFGPPRSRFTRPSHSRQPSQPQTSVPPQPQGRRASQSQHPLSRVSSQARLNSQAQPLEVNDILDFLSGRARRPSDAGADLDADIAAALRKELEAKDSAGGTPSLSAQDPESTILESLQEDIEKQASSSSSTGAPTTSSTSGPSGGPTDTSGKLETPKQEKPTISTSERAGTSSLPNPIVRRHSSVRYKDPQPKIEVSQRNTKNPKLPYSPSVNVYDVKDEYNIVLAIPGASLNDLDINFHPATNEIVIKGNINNVSSFNEKDLKHSEIRAGSVERRVKFPTLPKIVDEKIKAKYLNGLLSIKVPKNNEDEGAKKPKRKVTIEDVPDEELEYEEHAGFKEVAAE